MEENKRKMDIDESERKRRSELAKELGKRTDPITGRRLFGGSQRGAGRPKKKRVTEVMNEKIEANAINYWQRLHDIAMSKKADALSIQAINQIIAIANKETDIQAREETNLDGKPTEELIEIVSSRLARLADSGKLPYADFEGEAEEFTEAELAELNEGSPDEDEPEGTSGDGSTGSRFGASPFTRRPAE